MNKTQIFSQTIWTNHFLKELLVGMYYLCDVLEAMSSFVVLVSNDSKLLSSNTSSLKKLLSFPYLTSSPALSVSITSLSALSWLTYLSCSFEPRVLNMYSSALKSVIIWTVRQSKIYQRYLTWNRNMNVDSLV